jgi:hypothetical protein
MRFGDAIPSAEKLKYVRQSLVPGRILHLHCNFTHPPKNKFVVLVSVKSSLRVFVINSGITEWLQARPDLRDRQITIRQQDHNYLRHDSFLNCTETIQQISIKEMEDQLIQDLCNIKDMVTAQEREAIRFAITGCRTLSKRDIDAILGELPPG